MARLGIPSIHGINGQEEISVVVTPDGHAALMIGLEDYHTLQVHPIYAETVDLPSTQTLVGLAALELFAEKLLDEIRKAQADLEALAD